MIDKKYLISHAWMPISFIWLLILAVAVWNWGELIFIFNNYPLYLPIHRIYLIIILGFIWLNISLCFLLRNNKINEIIEEKQSNNQPSVDIINKSSFLEQKKHLLIGKSKDLIIIRHYGVKKPTFITECIYKLGIGDNFFSSNASTTNRIGLAASESTIYIEQYSSSNDEEFSILSQWKELVAQTSKRRKISPINGIVISIDYLTIIREHNWQNAYNEIECDLKLLQRTLGYVPSIYFLLNDAEEIKGFTELFRGQSETQKSALLGAIIRKIENSSIDNYRYLLERQFNKLQNDIELQIPGKIYQSVNQNSYEKIFRFPAYFAEFCVSYNVRLQQLSSRLSRIKIPPPRIVALSSCKEDNILYLKNFFLHIKQDMQTNSHYEKFKWLKQNKYKLLIFSSIVYLFISAIFWNYTIKNSQSYISSMHIRLKYLDKAFSDNEKSIDKKFSTSQIINLISNFDNILSDYKNNKSFLNFIVSDDISNGLFSTYIHITDEYLLKRIVKIIEDNLFVNEDKDIGLNRIYDALSIYLILSGEITVSETEVKQLFENTMRNTNGSENLNREEIAKAYLWLFRKNRPFITPNNDLISQARLKISNLSYARRALYILEDESRNENIARWQASDSVGQNANHRLFMNSSTSDSPGVFGLYTKKGFETVFVPRFSNTLRTVIGSREVWGKSKEIDFMNLARDTLVAYTDRFNRVWGEYLRKIDIRVPNYSIRTVAGSTYRKTSYSEEILSLLNRIADQTSLEMDAIQPNSELALASNTSKWRSQIPYSDLRKFLDKEHHREATQPVLDQLFSTLNAIDEYTLLHPIEYASYNEKTNIHKDLLQLFLKLQIISPDLPSPLRQWIQQFVENSKPALRGSIGQSLSELWNNQNYNLCKKLVANRYPFTRKAKAEISIDDFTELFGNNGIFARFTNENLKPFIETETTPWRWKQDYLSPSFSRESLSMFEKADQLRRSFFPYGSKKPIVALNVTPQNPPRGIEAAMMQTDGISITGTAQQNDTVSINWPLASNIRTSKVFIFTDSWHEITSANGSWSLFRMLDQGRIIKKENGQIKVTFTAMGKPVSFLVDFSALFPIFSRDMLENFSCNQINLEKYL